MKDELSGEKIEKTVFKKLKLLFFSQSRIWFWIKVKKHSGAEPLINLSGALEPRLFWPGAPEPLTTLGPCSLLLPVTGQVIVSQKKALNSSR